MGVGTYTTLENTCEIVTQQLDSLVNGKQLWKSRTENERLNRNRNGGYHILSTGIHNNARPI